MSIAIVLGGAALWIGPSAESADGQCGPFRYRLSDHANFQNPSVTLCANAPDLGAFSYGGFPWENFNNNVSSVKNNYADSTRVYFYDSVNYANFLVSYGAGTQTAYVGNALNDRFSSAKNNVACCN